MTLHRTLLLFLAIILSNCTAEVAAPGSGCVWRVSDEDSCLYLSGTIHLLREKDHPLPASYEKAYKECQRLIFELPPGPDRDKRLMQVMGNKGVLPEGEKLEKLLPLAVWGELLAWGEHRGLSADTFQSMRPWFAALLLMTTEFQALGARPDLGVEPVFEKKARLDNKETSGLETVDFQIGLFSDLKAALQVELLEQTLKEVENTRESFEEMITAWRSGDIEALHKLLSAESEKYPELLHLFIDARNAQWIIQLTAELAKPGNAMVLVGAGHLGGNKGVLAGLKARGFKVERVQ